MAHGVHQQNIAITASSNLKESTTQFNSRQLKYNITYYKSFWQLPSNTNVSQWNSEFHSAEHSTSAVCQITVRKTT